MKMFLFDNPAVEIWACLAMFKLKSPNLYFWPLYIAWFQHIQNVEPVSLALTKQLLDERKSLHLLLDSLRKQIDDGFDKLTNIECKSTEIIKIKGTIKADKLKLLKTLEEEYFTQKNALFEDIKTACAAAKRLEEISLCESVLTIVNYIERLIGSERYYNRPNMASRIGKPSLC